MNQDQYIDMCEQMGWEPDESQMPKDPSLLSFEVQQALLLLNVLPDKWEGMSGTWLGKDYAGLDSILTIYQIDNVRQVFELLQVAEKELGDFYAHKQKEKESLGKASRGR
jgi:hypothetical protein|tara:strand:- start:411 stop:740 length:330 start_codon:yes stop_codon:yes gene_type:complete